MRIERNEVDLRIVNRLFSANGEEARKIKFELENNDTLQAVLTAAEECSALQYDAFIRICLHTFGFDGLIKSFKSNILPCTFLWDVDLDVPGVCIEIPENIVSISSKSFRNTFIKNIWIPKSVKYIASDAVYVNEEVGSQLFFEAENADDIAITVVSNGIADLTMNHLKDKNRCKFNCSKEEFERQVNKTYILE